MQHDSFDLELLSVNYNVVRSIMLVASIELWCFAKLWCLAVDVLDILQG